MDKLSGNITAALTTAESELRRLNDDLEYRQLRRSDAISERESLRNLEDRDRAVRALDGDDAAPTKPQRLSKIAKLDKELASADAAMRLLRERIAEKRSECADLKRKFTSAAVTAFVDLQKPELEEIRSALKVLRVPLARLLAIDEAKQILLGNRFSIEEGQSAPIGGKVLVKRVVESLPERFLPAELKQSNLFSEAGMIAREIISSIENSSSCNTDEKDIIQ